MSFSQKTVLVLRYSMSQLLGGCLVARNVMKHIASRTWKLTWPFPNIYNDIGIGVTEGFKLIMLWVWCWCFALLDHEYKMKQGERSSFINDVPASSFSLIEQSFLHVDDIIKCEIVSPMGSAVQKKQKQGRNEKRSMWNSPEEWHVGCNPSSLPVVLSASFSS